MLRVLVLALAVAAATGCAVDDQPPGAPASTTLVPSRSAERPSTRDAGTPTTPTVPPRRPELDRPLIAAAVTGDAAQVRRLLADGASPAATDSHGATALVRAAYGNHLEAAAALIAAGADVNTADHTQQSAYLIATSEVGDDPRLLELTLRGGADVNAKDRFNGTGLIRAAERGHAAIVDRLIHAGIARDHINRLGYTALHEAIIFGNGGSPYLATVEALVRGSVDVNIPTGDGTRPVTLARRKGYQQIVTVLLQAGAHP